MYVVILYDVFALECQVDEWRVCRFQIDTEESCQPAGVWVC